MDRLPIYQRKLYTTKQGFDVDFDVFVENIRFKAKAVTDRAIKAVRAVPKGQRVFLAPGPKGAGISAKALTDDEEARLGL